MATAPYTPYTAPGPPSYKISIKFAQQGDLLGGWSETFWSQAPSIDLVTKQATGLRAALLLSKSPTIWSPSIRISQVGSFRAVTKMRFSGTSNPGNNNTAGAIVPGVKALVALADAQGRYTTQWLGGLPYTSFTSSGTWNPTANITNGLNSLYSFLQVNNFVIRKVASGAAKQTISAITQAGVVTCTAHGLPTNAKVRIGRVVDGLGVNGLWNVTVIDANTFSLNGLNAPGFVAVPQLTKSSYVQLYQWTIYNIVAPQQGVGALQQTAVLRATIHRVGRPPDQYTGRRKRRAS